MNQAEVDHIVDSIGNKAFVEFCKSGGSHDAAHHVAESIQSTLTYLLHKDTHNQTAGDWPTGGRYFAAPAKQASGCVEYCLGSGHFSGLDVAARVIAKWPSGATHAKNTAAKMLRNLAQAEALDQHWSQNGVAGWMQKLESLLQEVVGTPQQPAAVALKDANDVIDLPQSSNFHTNLTAVTFAADPLDIQVGDEAPTSMQATSMGDASTGSYNDGDLLTGSSESAIDGNSSALLLHQLAIDTLEDFTAAIGSLENTFSVLKCKWSDDLDGFDARSRDHSVKLDEIIARLSLPPNGVSGSIHSQCSKNDTIFDQLEDLHEQRLSSSIPASPDANAPAQINTMPPNVDENALKAIDACGMQKVDLDEKSERQVAEPLVDTSNGSAKLNDDNGGDKLPEAVQPESPSATPNSISTGTFKVVHQRVAIRKTPSTASDAVGSLKQADTVSGTIETVNGVEWLQLNEASCKKFVFGSKKKAYALIDGKSLGLGELLSFVKAKTFRGPLTEEEKNVLASSITPVHDNRDPQETRRLWIVTAGHDKRGIVVRSGESIKSSEYPGKLATGSTVEEIELQGHRLHYRRIRGDGPDFGWVTTKTKDGQLFVEPLNGPMPSD